MKVLRYVAALSALAFMLVVPAACREPRYQTVKIVGTYFEPAAAGTLALAGTLTYRWYDDADAGALPFDVAFVADAHCLDTGASYTLYGHSGEAILGLPLWYLAYDKTGHVAFEGLFTVEPRVPDANNPVATLAPFFHGQSGAVSLAKAP